MSAQSVDMLRQAEEAEDIEDKVLFDVAEWIDTETIARNILEELKWQGYKASFQNAKAVWLSLLCDLGDELRVCVKAVYNLEE